MCVRYRYDEHKKKRYKTVELIVAEEPWTPSVPALTLGQIVAVRVAAAEKQLRQQVKSAGGQWDTPRGVGKLRYAQVVALGLRERIVTASPV